MRTETQTPRIESNSRAAHIFAVVLMTIVLLFVAGVAGIALVWLARAALGA